MANLGEATVKVNYEMTDTAREVLRNHMLKILSEPAVLQELLKLLAQASRLEVGLHDGRTET